jgi:TorA maturation chaperone TorD
LLGSLLLYPDGAQVEATTALARELRDEAEPLYDFPFYPRLRSVLDALGELTEEEARKLEAEYADLFVLSISHAPCPLHESAYVDRTGRHGGMVAVDVGRAYAAAGLALPPSAQGELPDHAAFELEFLSHLCSQEAQAWEARRPEEAAELLRVQGQFLDRHVLRWFPALLHSVSVAARPASFYRELIETANALAVHDRDLAGLLAATHSSPAVVSVEQ